GGVAGGGGPADEVVVAGVVEEGAFAGLVGVPDVGADVLVGDGGAAGEHARRDDAIVVEVDVVAGGDGDAVVGRGDDLVVVGADVGGGVGGGTRLAVAQEDAAAGVAPVVFDAVALV